MPAIGPSPPDATGVAPGWRSSTAATAASAAALLEEANAVAGLVDERWTRRPYRQLERRRFRANCAPRTAGPGRSARPQPSPPRSLHHLSRAGAADPLADPRGQRLSLEPRRRQASPRRRSVQLLPSPQPPPSGPLRRSGACRGAAPTQRSDRRRTAARPPRVPRSMPASGNRGGPRSPTVRRNAGGGARRARGGMTSPPLATMRCMQRAVLGRASTLPSAGDRAGRR